MDLPSSIITISVVDLQAIQQRITDLQLAQQLSKCRCHCESWSDFKHALKPSNLKRKALDNY